LSPARVSQLRQELRDSWLEFRGELGDVQPVDLLPIGSALVSAGQLLPVRRTTSRRRCP
jgi:hypothetical protein